MKNLEEHVRVSQADESGDRIIIPAFSIPELIDDIREKADGNLTFWKNSIANYEINNVDYDYRNKVRYLMSLEWKELPKDYDVHHAGGELVEVVKRSIHQGISHARKR